MTLRFQSAAVLPARPRQPTVSTAAVLNKPSSDSESPRTKCTQPGPHEAIPRSPRSWLLRVQTGGRRPTGHGPTCALTAPTELLCLHAALPQDVGEWDVCGVSAGVHTPARGWVHTDIHIKNSWHVRKSNRKSPRSTKTEVFKPAPVSTECVHLDKPPDYYERECNSYYL